MPDQPSHFRGTSLVVQMESIALRGAPIIALIISAGAIIAQQGFFQMRRFGATVLVVDLIAFWSCANSAFADAIMDVRAFRLGDHRRLGSMKLHEEIDALTVMGLRPVEY